MGFGVDLQAPVQARREAQDEPGSSGCVCLSAASSASRRLIRASQGTRRAGMLGILSFGDFSLDKDKSAWSGFEQPKAGPEGEGQDGLHKSHSPIKGEILSVRQHKEYKRNLIVYLQIMYLEILQAH